MPHVSTTYYHPKDSEPGGVFAKQNSSDPFDDHRLPTNALHEKGVFAGFALEHDVWSYLQLEVTRTNETAYTLKIEMNGTSHSYHHVWDKAYKGDMPEYIDAMGIWFPNSRSYSYVELAAL
jgi:hypothetical protein